MPRSKKSVDVQSFHSAAVKAAEEGITLKQFAKMQGTLANNVKAVLYEGVVSFGLAPVEFPKPAPKARGRKASPTNLSEVSLYTGRAKVPYLTLKVPKAVVSRADAQENDIFEWKINRKGDIVGRNRTAQERESQS